MPFCSLCTLILGLKGCCNKAYASPSQKSPAEAREEKERPSVGQRWAAPGSGLPYCPGLKETLIPTWPLGLLLVTIRASCSFPHSHLHHPIFFAVLWIAQSRDLFRFNLKTEGILEPPTPASAHSHFRSGRPPGDPRPSLLAGRLLCH